MTMLLPLYHRTWSFLSDAHAHPRFRRKKLLMAAGVVAVALYVVLMVIYWVSHGASNGLVGSMATVLTGNGINDKPPMQEPLVTKPNGGFAPTLVTPRSDQEEDYHVYPKTKNSLAQEQHEDTALRKEEEDDDDDDKEEEEAGVARQEQEQERHAHVHTHAHHPQHPQHREEYQNEDDFGPPMPSARDNRKPSGNPLYPQETSESITQRTTTSQEPLALLPTQPTRHHPTNLLIRLLLPLVAGFCFGFLGSMPIAGPTSAIVLRLGLQGKYQNALTIAFGGAISEATYAGIAFWGFGSFLAGAKFIVPASKLIGAVVFTVVGLVFIRSDVRPTLDSDLNASKGSKLGKSRDELCKNVLLGLTMSGINPALLATYTGAIATVYGTGLLEFTMALALLFAVGVCCGITTWFYLLVSLLKKYKQRLKNQTLSAIMRALGGFLLFLGVLCAKSSIQYFFGSSSPAVGSTLSPTAH